MNKAELINAIAKKSGLPKATCEKSLNSFMTVVKDTLKKGDKIMLVGFGTFQVQQRKATTGVNPRTKQKINIPAKKVAKLKFSDSINDNLNKKR
jgi:DNA-binding protein HU-beta